MFTVHQVTHNINVSRMGSFPTLEDAKQRVIDEHPENKRDFARYVVLNPKGFRVYEVQGGTNPTAELED